MALLLVGCSGRFSFGAGNDAGFLDAGKELIEGDLAAQIGLGPLEATCVGQNLGAGDSFDCTATAGQLTPIEFTGTIEEDEESVLITSNNLLLAAQVEQVESFAAGLIEEQTARVIGADNFECGDVSVIISSGEILECQVTDPGDGTVYNAPVTVEDLEQLSITVNIGEPVG